MASFRQFLAENKIWWVTPIVVVAAFVVYVMVFDGVPEGEGDSPFIYDEY